MFHYCPSQPSITVKIKITQCAILLSAIPLLLCNLALHYAAEWPHLLFTDCIINILNKTSETPQQIWIHFQSCPINKNYKHIYFSSLCFYIALHTSTCPLIIPELFLSPQRWDFAACAVCQTEFGLCCLVYLSLRPAEVNVEQNGSTRELPAQVCGCDNKAPCHV